MSKLHDFAQAVGADIKEIKTTLAGKADKGSEGITEERLTQQSRKLKPTLLVVLLKSLILLKNLLIKSPLVVAILTVALSLK